MGAVLIPNYLVPVVWSDADWAFDIKFPEEDWTGSTVSVTFAFQGFPFTMFEVTPEAPTKEDACNIRLNHTLLAELIPGTYTAAVRENYCGLCRYCGNFRTPSGSGS